jgi:hypothetical protein
MPAENQQAVPKLEFNTPDAGRTYIANLFETVLRRHDYRQYISERLAGDFACTLAQHFEEIKAREAALQLLLNERDEQNHSLEQRRQAEQQACQAAERNAARYLWLRDKPTFIWLIQDWFPSGAEVTDVDAVIDAAINAGAEAVDPEAEMDKDWRMNPCKQGHRDVGAAGGVAHCYTCDEKIEAVTTQEAFEHWNATHPAEQPAPVAVVMPQDEKLMEIVERYPNGDPLEYDAALRQIKQ